MGHPVYAIPQLTVETCPPMMPDKTITVGTEATKKKLQYDG